MMNTGPFDKYYTLVKMHPEGHLFEARWLDVLTLICERCGHILFFDKEVVKSRVKSSLEGSAEKAPEVEADPASPLTEEGSK